MQKNIFLFLSTLFIFFVFFSSANAASLAGPSFSSLCQCDTSKQVFSLCTTLSGNYGISAVGNFSSWITAAPAIVSMPENSCSPIFLFVTPSCFADSGDYNYSLVVLGPEKATAAYKLTVNQCHTVNFGVSPQLNSAKPCEKSSYDLSLKNTGGFSDEFVFTQRGLPDGWATYPQEKIVLSPGESFNGSIDVSSSCNVDANTYPFTFSVSNTRTNVSVSKSLSFAVRQINPFSVGGVFSGLTSLNQTACQGLDQNITLTVNSLSNKPDEVSVSLLDANRNPLDSGIATVLQKSVSIDSNKSASITLLVKKHGAGNLSGYISATSKTYGKTYTAPLQLNYENCYAFSLARASTNAKDCLGEEQQNVVINNIGTRGTDINFTAYLDGTLAENKFVNISGGASKTVSFILRPQSAGVSHVAISARSAFASQGLDYNFEFENCYSSQINAQNIGACSGENIDQNISITNSGTRAQSFSLSIDSNWLSLYPSGFSLPAGQARVVSLRGLASSNPAGEFVISAHSQNADIQRVISVMALNSSECNAIGVAAPPSPVLLACCSGKAVDLNVTNTGVFDQNISLAAATPPWITFSENSFALKPAQSKTVFVYFSPDANAAGLFVARIIASTGNGFSKEVDINLDVSPVQPFVLPQYISVSSLWIDKNVSGKSVVVGVSVKNDSNSGFFIKGISIQDINSVADFNKGAFLSPGESISAKLRLLLDSNASLPDGNVSFIIGTSAGTFVESQAVGTEQEALTITGLFEAYTAPALGLLLFILLVLVLLSLRARLSKRRPIDGVEEKVAGANERITETLEKKGIVEKKKTPAKEEVKKSKKELKK